MDTSGMQEGELRMRVQCNLCGTVTEAHALMKGPEIADKVASIIREDPDVALAIARAALQAIDHWETVQLADGGTVDICAECVEHSPFLPRRSWWDD